MGIRKYLIILAALLLISCESRSQESIELCRNSGGLFEIECTMNDRITIPFYIDSGCSESTIPVHIFITLYKAGTITEADRLPSRIFTLADGSTTEKHRFVLRKIKVGDKVFYNIPISITENVNAPLLLGQDVLSRFGMILLDYENNLLIHN